jgi:hypothetical protein
MREDGNLKLEDRTIIVDDGTQKLVCRESTEVD